MTNDLVSDMLTRMRNASVARHAFAKVRYCKLNVAILRVLETEGYITSFKLEQEKSSIVIRVFLKYKGWWIKRPLFSIMKRVSKPGQRVFSGYKNFQRVMDVLKYDQGIAIISTSIGVMSHSKATKLKKGGEVICYIA